MRASTSTASTVSTVTPAMLAMTLITSSDAAAKSCIERLTMSYLIQMKKLYEVASVKSIKGHIL